MCERKLLELADEVLQALVNRPERGSDLVLCLAGLDVLDDLEARVDQTAQQGLSLGHRGPAWAEELAVYTLPGVSDFATGMCSRVDLAQLLDNLLKLGLVDLWLGCQCHELLPEGHEAVVDGDEFNRQHLETVGQLLEHRLWGVSMRHRLRLTVSVELFRHVLEDRLWMAALLCVVLDNRAELVETLLEPLKKVGRVRARLVEMAEYLLA